MKLTLILLTAAFLQIHAAGNAQKVSITAKNMPLEQVFAAIEQQTGYAFFYDVAVIPGTKPVTITANQLQLEALLDAVFKIQPLEYAIKNKTIVVSSKWHKVPPKGIDALLIAKDATPLPFPISGVVRDAAGNPLAGASVTVRSSNKTVITDENGGFQVNAGRGDVLEISYVGYLSTKLLIMDNTPVIIIMERAPTQMDTSEVVSTGFQVLTKERATGSFEKLDNKTFNRLTSTNFLDRLEGMLAGVFFNSRNNTPNKLETAIIRGPSTFSYMSSSSKNPLIILDNMPYEGDITNINPNDIATVTVLKDAAASSIWGVRAANGVIVLTTKKGSYNKPLQVNFNANINITEKPNLFYSPELNASDFIDLQTKFYEDGYFKTMITNIGNKRYANVLPELVKILHNKPANAEALIDAMRGYDLRSELSKHVYRKEVKQQYAVNISSGTNNLQHYLSLGFDKNLSDIIDTDLARFTANSYIKFKPLKNLEFHSNIIYTQNNSNRIASFGYAQPKWQDYAPYSRLADEAGNPLVLAKKFDKEWAAEQGALRGVDWLYRPLDEQGKAIRKSSIHDILMELGGTYNLKSGFSTTLIYRYQRSFNDSKELYNKDSYYARDMHNYYISLDPNASIKNEYGSIVVGSTLTKAPIPYSGILRDLTNITRHSQALRGQLGYDNNWNNKHQLNAIIGAEVAQNITETGTQPVIYGYDDEYLITQVTDFKSQFPLAAFNPATSNGSIPGGETTFAQATDRNIAYYINGSYTYHNKYILSFSARKDGSNLFGVNANDKLTPLWSSGIAWNLYQEDFYKASWLPYLKLRVTYGYNGNRELKSVAIPVISVAGMDYYTGRTFASIPTPPNPSLQWEKVGILNLGVDFALANNRISGSLEYYDKNASNLLTSSIVDNTIGFSSLVMNSGSLNSKGVDITINASPLRKGNFEWKSTLLFSYAKSKTTKIFFDLYEKNPKYLIGDNLSLSAIQGYAFAVFSYRWAGLDPQDGSIQGFDNDGNITKDFGWFSPASNPTKLEQVKYHGTHVPLYYGSFINSFSWKQVEVSARLMYKFDYYFFNRNVPLYSRLYEKGSMPSGIKNRWQKPGDENHTTVPAIPANLNDGNLSYADDYYRYSEVNVLKGDHIRLQDITLQYNFFGKKNSKTSMQVYGSLRNIGILWRANEHGVDPDVFSEYTLPAPKEWTMGVRVQF